MHACPPRTHRNFPPVTATGLILASVLWCLLALPVQARTDDGAGTQADSAAAPREREQFARFSAPIYRNLSPVAVLRVEAAHRTDGGRGLAALLATGLRMVLRGGFSYGPALDDALSRSRAPVYRSTADNAALLEMLASGRYDMTLMEQEEATELLRRSPRLFQALELVLLAGPDILVGQPQTRHLMCGRGVDEATLRRIDDAIAEVLGDVTAAP